MLFYPLDLLEDLLIILLDYNDLQYGSDMRPIKAKVIINLKSILIAVISDNSSICVI